MNINKNDIKKAQQAASARWGKWVGWVIGAIIGALAAAGYITVSGCGTAANISLSSDQGMLSVSRAADGSIIVSAVPAVPQVIPSKK